MKCNESQYLQNNVMARVEDLSIFVTKEMKDKTWVLLFTFWEDKIPCRIKKLLLKNQHLKFNQSGMLYSGRKHFIIENVLC